MRQVFQSGIFSFMGAKSFGSSITVIKILYCVGFDTHLLCSSMTLSIISSRNQKNLFCDGVRNTIRIFIFKIIYFLDRISPAHNISDFPEIDPTKISSSRTSTLSREETKTPKPDPTKLQSAVSSSLLKYPFISQVF